MKIHAFFDVDRTIRKGSAALDFCNHLADLELVDDDFREIDTLIRDTYSKNAFDYPGKYRDFVNDVVKIHGTVLKGLNRNQLTAHYNAYVKKHNAFFEWTETLFKKLQKSGAKTILVSAGISPAIEAIAQYLKTDKFFASEPEVKDNIYTGRMLKILQESEKEKLVKQYIEGFEETDDVLKIGFGDSTADLPMLELMDKVFLINPHQLFMRSEAKRKGWQIIEEGYSPLQAVDELIAQFKNE